MIGIWVKFYLLSSSNQYMINQWSHQNWFSSAWGSMHLSMCLMMIYVIIWRGRLGVNKKFWLVLTWSGFCQLYHHRAIQTIIKHVNSKQTSLVQVTLLHDNYLAFLSCTGEYWYYAIPILPQPNGPIFPSKLKPWCLTG